MKAVDIIQNGEDVFNTYHVRLGEMWVLPANVTVFSTHLLCIYSCSGDIEFMGRHACLIITCHYADMVTQKDDFNL